MEKLSEFMMYEMKLVRNSTSIGYFSCVPATDMGVDEIIEYLRNHPNDQSMHNYLLFRLVEFNEDELDKLIEEKKDN